ncbi:Rho termination factor N-terminal domain-containing protein, partial [Tsukamurella pulmonis]
KAHLVDVARRLEIRGRSTMRKSELIDAIERANERARSDD